MERPETELEKHPVLLWLLERKLGFQDLKGLLLGRGLEYSQTYLEHVFKHRYQPAGWDLCHGLEPITGIEAEKIHAFPTRGKRSTKGKAA